MTDLMGRLINSAVFTGPIWLPVANIPASVQADDVDMIKSLADIRQRVIASSASILKHRNLPGWGLHRKGEWIVTMMRLFFDRDLVCDNLAWYCQVYDMESFLSTFRHMSLILEYTWADGAERHTCDAFVAMDIIGLIRDSQLLWVDWMRLLYRFVSGISTSALAEAPEESDGPRAPTKCQLDGYVDYLYQPNNLLTVCLSLSALFANAQLTDDNESEMGLLRLMRMRPDDPAWPDCIARMQAFATQNDPTAMRVDRDTYLCVHTFQLQTYTAEQVSEIETRVRKYAGILQGWLNDGLPAAEEPPPGQVARCIAEASDATKIDDCDSETDKDKRQSIFSIFRRFKFSPGASPSAPGTPLGQRKRKLVFKLEQNVD
ncbi:hypothetical protein BDZ89DRAFT_706621 [Hymenopellis radicata]|nr:hypothetical protein BDZ89DRAFT_706621 [Hymenopellis radicata]